MSFIRVDNVTLEFPSVSIKHPKPRRQIASAGLSPGGDIVLDGHRLLKVRALDDVSIALDPGDRLALIGHNGAGKTTLLRVMAGLYPPTGGAVTIEGRIAPLFNLNFGMDAEDTGYDNILMRGMFLGMSRAEIASKTDSIAEFSELGEFLHMPIRTYSSGMRARLAFAISTHVEADILLLDEVVAAGDASFFHKARQRLEYLANRSNILVLASHSNKVLREICQKGLLLERGKVKAAGALDDVLDVYESTLRPGISVSRLSTRSGHENVADKPTRMAAKKAIRILLINDTGALPNPGCRAVRTAYKLLFGRFIRGTTISHSIPVDYWAESFRALSVPWRDAIYTEDNAFPRAADNVPCPSIEEWERVRLSLTKSDTDIGSLLTDCDLVVVNGEGSIHHNSVRSLALLALMKTAIEAGRKVVLLNSTIQAMSGPLLSEVLPHLALIHVREQRSQAFLNSLRIASIASPDLAFLAMDDVSETRNWFLNADGCVLVTAGVTANRKNLEVLFRAIGEIGMRPVYLLIGERGEMELARYVCPEMRVPVIDAGSLGVAAMINCVGQFPLAISGRHHVNVFLMRAGVPFVPLTSNTWKIEGTLSLVGYPVAPVKTHAELADVLRKVQKDTQEISAACKQSFVTGRAAVDDLPRTLYKTIPD